MRSLMGWLAAAILAVSTGPVAADTFRLDYGNTSTNANQVTITRVPVVKPGGVVVYRDVTIQLQLNAAGKFVVSRGFPRTSPSPTLVAAKITAGRYYTNSPKIQIDVIGPSVGPNGREQWSLTGFNNTLQMTVYSGPVKGHPMQVRINAAGISSSPFQFGESFDRSILSTHFQDGSLISLSPAGADILLQSHSENGDDDRVLPFTSVLMRKCGVPPVSWTVKGLPSPVWLWRSFRS